MIRDASAILAGGNFRFFGFDGISLRHNHLIQVIVQLAAFANKADMHLPIRETTHQKIRNKITAGSYCH